MGARQTFCTSMDGLTEHPCDVGTCVVPGYPLGPPAIQTDGGLPYVACATDDECDLAHGFGCDTTTFSDGDRCAQVRRVCTP